MPYTLRYSLADPIIAHLNTVVLTVSDPFITSRFIGLVSISAVTVYELCIKDIFEYFSHSKHKVFGVFVNSYFYRLNGRIKLSNIKEDYLPKFGDVYAKRFTKNLEVAEKISLRNTGKSILSSYGNIIEWRHQFAHQGIIPSTVTYTEAVDSYQLGKEVIRILAESMKR